MSVSLYMDVHVPGPITRALLLRGIDVITAQADESSLRADPELLARATELDRVLFTQDRDFLAIGADWQRIAKPFTGILFADQLGITIGRAVEDLTIIASAAEPLDCSNQIHFLPL